MRVLVSNDDGVDAPGILMLARQLASIGDVVVVAPDRDRSGASNSLTLDQPIRVKRLAEDRFSVAGTPTDCVYLALSGMLKLMPDIVVSGINSAANLGDDVIYSGTVSAARISKVSSHASRVWMTSARSNSCARRICWANTARCSAAGDLL